jgi:[protein-PII] uridylyltransferase
VRFDPQAFAASLPESYRRNFDPAAVIAHAQIARAREGAAANVGTFPSNRTGTALCVVADDRPGLLATISAALVIAELDVIEAEAYTRREPGRSGEAIDIFWVRPDPVTRRGRAFDDGQLSVLRSTLIGLLEGRVERRLEPGSRPFSTPGTAETIVRFIEGDDGSFTTLEVETGDRSGLLLALSQALFNQRVQIIGSQVKTNGTRVFDRFSIVELDGSPISPARRLQIQVAVLTAVDPLIGAQDSAEDDSAEAAV